jgi:hypothetical protein
MMKRHREAEDTIEQPQTPSTVAPPPTAAGGPSNPSKSKGVPIPNHKVGRELMYERYAPQYDRLMNCHDCSLIRSFLLQLLLEVTSPTPPSEISTLPASEEFSKQDDAASSAAVIATLRSRSIGVADFGCGSGRIGLMVLPCAKRIMCFDRAGGMLKECKRNLQESAAHQRIGLVEVGQLAGLAPSDTQTPTAKVIKKFGVAAESAHTSGDVGKLTGESSEPVTEAPRAEADHAAESPLWNVELLLGQKSFEDIQGGCLQALFPTLDGSGNLEDRTTTAPFAAKEGSVGESRGFHLAVCAWSLSYVMNAQWGTTKWHGAVNAVLSELENLLRRSHAGDKPERDGARGGSGAIVIIETLGTTPTPSRKNSLHQFLEEQCGFKKSWVRTDYTFQTKQDGVAMCKFFFGDAVMQRFIELGPDQLTLPECTGIWVKRIAF